MSYLTFQPLVLPDLRHAFTLRDERGSSVKTLENCGFSAASFVLAEQPHGSRVALVDCSHRGQTVPDVDALITRDAEVSLVIRTADCGPVFLFDSVQRAIGLVHSGKKGTEADVLTATIRAMEKSFHTRAKDVRVVLGPCIRPPHYETDFASEIARQARRAGVGFFHDEGWNTAADLSRFYSYRAEKGKTGRHYSVLGLKR
ncbi:MAG: polyphenol oxidase family protein [bacterium]